MNCLRKSFIVGFFGSYSLLFGVEQELALIENGLSDGIYIIERTAYLPIIVRGQDAAQQLISDSPVPEPDRGYYKLHLAGEDFILQIMEEVDGTIVPKGNHFASISENGSWIFFERQGRLVSYDTDVRSYSEIPGPGGNGLNYTLRLLREMRLLGLHPIDWSTASIGPNLELSGVATDTFGGHPFTGNLRTDDNGTIVGVRYRIEDSRFEHDVELFYDDDFDFYAETIKTRRASSRDPWEFQSGYRVVQREEIPEGYDMSRHWETFGDSETRVFRYHHELGRTTHIDREGHVREFGGDRNRYSDDRSEVNTRTRLIIGVMIFGALAVFPVLLVLRRGSG